jgi:hypothetical protein
MPPYPSVKAMLYLTDKYIQSHQAMGVHFFRIVQPRYAIK